MPNQIAERRFASIRPAQPEVRSDEKARTPWPKAREPGRECEKVDPTHPDREGNCEGNWPKNLLLVVLDELIA